MIRLRDLEETELLDMLSEHTSHYTRMLNENDKSREFYECKRMIEKITEEISARKEAEKRHDRINDPSSG
jgi:hypothetical protein